MNRIERLDRNNARRRERRKAKGPAKVSAWRIGPTCKTERAHRVFAENRKALSTYRAQSQGEGA